MFCRVSCNPLRKVNDKTVADVKLPAFYESGHRCRDDSCHSKDQRNRVEKITVIRVLILLSNFFDPYI